MRIRFIHKVNFFVQQNNLVFQQKIATKKPEQYMNWQPECGQLRSSLCSSIFSDFE